MDEDVYDSECSVEDDNILTLEQLTSVVEGNSSRFILRNKLTSYQGNGQDGLNMPPYTQQSSSATVECDNEISEQFIPKIDGLNMPPYTQQSSSATVECDNEISEQQFIPVIDCTPQHDNENPFSSIINTPNNGNLENWEGLEIVEPLLAISSGHQGEEFDNDVDDPPACWRSNEGLEVVEPAISGHQGEEHDVDDPTYSPRSDSSSSSTTSSCHQPASPTPKPAHEQPDEDRGMLSEHEEPTGNPDRKRQRRSFDRKVPCKAWSRQQTKNLRLKGEAYVGYRRKDRKSSKVVVHDVQREARKMGPRCKDDGKCRKVSTRACAKVSEGDREKLFNTFWTELQWEERKMLVISLVTIQAPKQPKEFVKRARRAVSYTYHLRTGDDKVPVCQTLFLNTVGLKFSTVGRWLMQSSKLGSSRSSGDQPSSSVPDTVPVQADNDPNTDSKADARSTSHRRKSVQARTDHMCDFILGFPKMESHYCRASSQKLYLQTDIKTISEFYVRYKHVCEQEQVTPLSHYVFRQHCHAKNVDVYQPRKDQCDECFRFKNGSVTPEAHQKHIELKNRARQEKEDDKIKAKNKLIHLMCVDVMAVQLLPKIEASIAYYKMKLAVHNYTMYNLENDDVLCCWFTECDTTMEASTFASCLIPEIERLLNEDKREVVIFSDGCSYQNKNNILSNALLAVSMKHDVIIHQKYFEKGHSQMEADSVHSLVERSCKNEELYMPHEFDSITRKARKGRPYRSKTMTFSDFKDFSRPSMMKYDSIRPGSKPHDPTVNELKWLKYDPSGIIEFKLKFDDEFAPLPRRPKTNVKGPFDYPPMHTEPVKITKDKFDDLVSMTNLIPPHCRDFYLRLPHHEASKRKAKQQEKLQTSKAKKSRP